MGVKTHGVFRREVFFYDYTHVLPSFLESIGVKTYGFFSYAA